MPKKQKDKPPEMWDGGGGYIDEEEILRKEYPELKIKYELYLNSQKLIVKLGSALLEQHKLYPSWSSRINEIMKWLCGDKTPSKRAKYIKRLTKLIRAASVRNNRRKYDYDVLYKMLKD